MFVIFVKEILLTFRIYGEKNKVTELAPVIFIKHAINAMKMRQ